MYTEVFDRALSIALEIKLGMKNWLIKRKSVKPVKLSERRNSGFYSDSIIQ